MNFFQLLFGPGNIQPHGYSGLWSAGLPRLNAVSDSLIAISYFIAALTLLWFVRRRRDLPFSSIFSLVGAAIVACGAAHAMAVWNLRHADYSVAIVLKAIAAATSAVTAIWLMRLVPTVLALPSINQWASANVKLENEIHERRELELDLRIREASYREQAELLDLTHDAILVKTPDAKIIYWNRAAEKLYGWQRKEAHGKLTHDLLRTEFPLPRAVIEAQVIAQGMWEGELVHTRRDGSKVVVSSRWALRTDAAGKPVSVLESNRDVTERKLVEDRFRNLLEAAPDAMVIVNDAGQIHLVNAQTERLFGYSRAEILGQPLEILIPQRFREEHIAYRRGYHDAAPARVVAAGSQLSGRRKNGSEFPVEISMSPLQTEKGLLVSSAIRDITERRETEAQIQALNAILNRNNSELVAVNKELEAFSYSVSHDLRAPLRHIDGFARILLDEDQPALTEQGRRCIERVLSAASHMGHLVDDLLNLSRVGRREMTCRHTSLTEIARAAMEDLNEEMRARKIEWKLEELPEADCDPGLLRLVFSNLFSNAVKFTRPRQVAVIEVGATRRGQQPAFFVRDNGVGFDPQYADKLFGVFQRLHRDEEFEGTGVGLATVQRIIQRHGGEVWAESKPDCGTTLYFTLGPPASASGGRAAFGGAH
ncbi:MAG: PAS domain S-box protein [Candidatus Acidiferrales bacterium]